MKKRRRFKQAISLKERLSLFAQAARAKASSLPIGSEQESWLRKARYADTAAHIDEWINSPGLRAPT
jgi:hypothetical protein